MSFLQNVLWRIVSFFSGPPEVAQDRDSGARRGARWARLGVRVNLLLGVAAILGFALSQTKPWLGMLGILSLGFLIASASFLVGATLGFLFGIPRTLQQNPSPAAPKPTAAEETETEPPAEDGRQTGYRSNTSLEQISDWLTKILVGLSLTQWDDLRRGFQDMVEYLAPALGGSEVFVGGTILVGSLCGFFYGYLPTRLFLWLALKQSDIEGSGMEDRKDRNVKEAEELRGTGDGGPVAPAAAGTERTAPTTEETRKQIESLAREYETTRAKEPSGSGRTQKMEDIVSRMRKLAPQMGEDVKAELQSSGSPGKTLAAIAWIQVHPRADLLHWLAERVGAEKPFVAYHAALALLTAARDRSIDARQVLDAVKRAQALLEPTEAGSDRAKLLADAEREAKARMT